VRTIGQIESRGRSARSNRWIADNDHAVAEFDPLSPSLGRYPERHKTAPRGRNTCFLLEAELILHGTLCTDHDPNSIRVDRDSSRVDSDAHRSLNHVITELPGPDDSILPSSKEEFPIAAHSSRAHRPNVSRR
jgi:hypothetical protein